MSIVSEWHPPRPHCLPGCNRLDGHDGREPGACMGEDGVLKPGPLDLVHRHPDIPVHVPVRTAHPRLRDDGQMSETGIFAYDLNPPAPLTPTTEPIRHPGRPSPRPRWVPPPLPDGFVRVELEDDYYTGPEFSDWAAEETGSPGRVFDIPREQYERWKAARDAYAAMQEEITALREEWLHGPGCALAGWVRKDKPYQVQP